MEDEYDEEGYEEEDEDGEELSDEEVIAVERERKLKPKSAGKKPKRDDAVGQDTEQLKPIGDGGWYQHSWKLDDGMLMTQEGRQVPVTEVIRVMANQVMVMYQMLMQDYQKGVDGKVKK